ncbi:hypothetical protein [Borreliella afzelii]
MNLIYKNSLEQNTKTVNSTKKFIFKKLHLEILEKNNLKNSKHISLGT